MQTEKKMYLGPNILNQKCITCEIVHLDLSQNDWLLLMIEGPACQFYQCFSA